MKFRDPAFYPPEGNLDFPSYYSRGTNLLRTKPMAWIFTIWSLLIGSAIIPNLLDAPHYQYLMSGPGGVYTWGAVYIALGVAMMWLLIAGKDAAYAATLGVMGVVSVVVAMMLGVAAFTVEKAVNLGPTWGMIGVVALVYALQAGEV